MYARKNSFYELNYVLDRMLCYISELKGVKMADLASFTGKPRIYHNQTKATTYKYNQGFSKRARVYDVIMM